VLDLTFEVVLTGDTRFVDGVTFLGHAVLLFGAVHFAYIETCWHSTHLLESSREFKRVQRGEKKTSALMKKPRR
jgi:hypothetical protein